MTLFIPRDAVKDNLWAQAIGFQTYHFESITCSIKQEPQWRGAQKESQGTFDSRVTTYFSASLLSFWLALLPASLVPPFPVQPDSGGSFPQPHPQTCWGRRNQPTGGMRWSRSVAIRWSFRGAESWKQYSRNIWKQVLCVATLFHGIPKSTSSIRNIAKVFF